VEVEYTQTNIKLVFNCVHNAARLNIGLKVYSSQSLTILLIDLKIKKNFRELCVSSSLIWLQWPLEQKKLWKCHTTK